MVKIVTHRTFNVAVTEQALEWGMGLWDRGCDAHSVSERGSGALIHQRRTTMASSTTTTVTNATGTTTNGMEVVSHAD